MNVVRDAGTTSLRQAQTSLGIYALTARAGEDPDCATRTSDQQARPKRVLLQVGVFTTPRSYNCQIIFYASTQHAGLPRIHTLQHHITGTSI